MLCHVTQSSQTVESKREAPPPPTETHEASAMRLCGKDTPTGLPPTPIRRYRNYIPHSSDGAAGGRSAEELGGSFIREERLVERTTV